MTEIQGKKSLPQMQLTTYFIFIALKIGRGIPKPNQFVFGLVCL